MVGKNDGSLDEYIDAGHNGFIVEDTEEAARVIHEILSGIHNVNVIKAAAIKDSRERCFSMNDRFDAEVALIERVVETGKTGLHADADGISRLERSNAN